MRLYIINHIELVTLCQSGFRPPEIRRLANSHVNILSLLNCGTSRE